MAAGTICIAIMLCASRQATHIWNHLTTTVLNMDAGADEMVAIEARDGQLALPRRRSKPGTASSSWPVL